MSDEDDDAGDGQAPTQAVTTNPEVSAGAAGAVAAWMAKGGGSTTAAAAVAAAIGDEPEVPAPAAKPAAAAVADAAAEAPEPDDLAERLARAAAGDTRPTRKDELRGQLAARGVPEGLIKTLVSHGKTKEIEAWLGTPVPVPSQTDTAARQPSAPSPAPAATPLPASREPGIREALAGVRSALDSSGVFEKSDTESIAGLLEAVVERQDRLERSQAEALEASRLTTHEAARGRYQQEIDAAKEGLGGRYPEVLDPTVYRDQVAPIFEALATSPATAQRSLKDNLAAACRAALVEQTDGDRKGRKLQTEEAARHKPVTPRTGTQSTQTISQEKFSAEVVKLRLSGASKDDIAEYTEKWSGRVK